MWGIALLGIAGIIMATGVCCCCIACPMNCSKYCLTGTEQPLQITVTISGVVAPTTSGLSCHSCGNECSCTSLNATYVINRTTQSYDPSCLGGTLHHYVDTSVTTVCDAPFPTLFTTNWSLGIRVSHECNAVSSPGTAPPGAVEDKSNLWIGLTITPTRTFYVFDGITWVTYTKLCGAINYYYRLERCASLDCGADIFTASAKTMVYWNTAIYGSVINGTFKYNCPNFCDFTGATITVSL